MRYPAPLVVVTSPLGMFAAGLAGWIALPTAATSASQVVLFLLLVAAFTHVAEEITGGHTDDGDHA